MSLFGQLTGNQIINMNNNNELINILPSSTTVSKIAFCYTGIFNFAPKIISSTLNYNNMIKIIINNNNDEFFYLGKTGILELQDVLINDIKIIGDFDKNKMTIDYQIYSQGGNTNESVLNQQ